MRQKKKNIRWNTMRILTVGFFGVILAPLHMIAQTEHERLVLIGHLVAANALEYARAIMQRVRQHMAGRLRPRHQLAVLPDVIDLGDVGHATIPFSKEAARAFASRRRFRHCTPTH